MKPSNLTKDQLVEKINELKNQIEKLEKRKQYEVMADETKIVFDSFVAVGFTEDQAIKLTSSALTSAAILGHR